MIVQIVSVFIAIVSVAVAVWEGVKSQRLSKENAILQRRLLEIEESKENERKKNAAKAQIQARITETINYGRKGYRLSISNNGECEARNITLKIDGKPFDEHCASSKNERPAKIIGPHSEATRILAISSGCAPPWEIEISWEDDSGEPGHYRSTLTF